MSLPESQARSMIMWHYFSTGQYYLDYAQPRNYQKAVKHFRKGAEELGSVPCMVNLADCYYDGKGVNKDYTEAVKRYR